MKGFYITIALFLVLVISGILNFLFINNVYSEMNEMISDISESPCPENEEKIKRLSEYWEEANSIVGISVNFLSIDSVSNLIDSVYVYNEQGDDIQLSYSIELLINAVENIKRLEVFSIKNIL